MKLLKKLLLVGLVSFGLLMLVGLVLWGIEKYERYQYLRNLEDTASPNVHVLSDTVYIDYLEKKRTLFVYLPPNYHEDTLHYPVLYFLDGPSLFNDLVLQGPEWQVDEVLDSLANRGNPTAIVIGVDNSEERMTEYKPYLSPHVPDEKKVTGKEHAAWIANDLKAWVDATYRTRPGPAHTSIGGASLGGLMAYYMLMNFPNTYSNALVFSPSFWVNDSIFSLHEQHPDIRTATIYMNAGEYEESIVKDAKKMYHLLLEAGMPQAQLRFDIEAKEGHSHPTWRKGFRKAYPWLMHKWKRLPLD